MGPTFTEEQLRLAVSESDSYSGILRKLKLATSGSGTRTSIKKYSKIWNIDCSHLLNASEWGKKHWKEPKTKIDLKDILVENSYYNRVDLKKRLYKLQLKTPICELCGQDELWKGKKISLILDHINGINNDNRLENLRIVCPNCNATLDTHCTKNRKIEKIIYYCSCGNTKYKKAKFCRKCTPKNREKITWPSKEELTQLIKEYPMTVISEQLGISNKAIKKRCNKLEILCPPQGYFLRKEINRL